MATVLVQNRVNWAMASLPTDVQRQGIIVKKASTSFVTYCVFIRLTVLMTIFSSPIM